MIEEFIFTLIIQTKQLNRGICTWMAYRADDQQINETEWIFAPWTCNIILEKACYKIMFITAR